MERTFPSNYFIYLWINVFRMSRGPAALSLLHVEEVVTLLTHKELGTKEVL